MDRDPSIGAAQISADAFQIGASLRNAGCDLVQRVTAVNLDFDESVSGIAASPVRTVGKTFNADASLSITSKAGVSSARLRFCLRHFSKTLRAVRVA